MIGLIILPFVSGFITSVIMIETFMIDKRRENKEFYDAIQLDIKNLKKLV